MQLSSRQRNWLKLNKKFEDEPPTLLKLISLSAIAVVVPAMVCAMAIAILAAMNILNMYFVMVFLGMAIGAFARDVGRFRVVAHLWPVVQYVTDWRKVDELLAADAALKQRPTTGQP